MEQGNIDGLYALGLSIEKGNSGSGLSKEAKDAYEEAALKGNAPAEWRLARYFLNEGFQDPEREEKGIIFGYQAADQGYEPAVRGLDGSGNTVEKLAAHYAANDQAVTMRDTMYEGRAARCEAIQAGDILQWKIVKDKSGSDALEFFKDGGSLGLAFQESVGKIIGLLKVNRAELWVVVESCIPKSKRGSRAKNADVKLRMILKERKPETPEEKKKRLRAAEEERKAKKKALEEKRKKKKKKEKRKKNEKERRPNGVQRWPA